ncbi:MAG: helix-turn-helix domain-containing protein [Piscinibacter sp.]
MAYSEVLMSVLPLLSIQLRARREARGLSQEEAAELLGVDKDTLSRWERGLNRPRGVAAIDALKSHYGATQRELDDWYGEWILREESAEERYFVRGYDYLMAHEIDEEELVRALIELDLLLVPRMCLADLGTVDQWTPVFRASPFTWRILTHGERIVGYWLYVCLKEEQFALAKQGGLRDSEITVDTIEAPVYLAPNRPYRMYVVMIGVHPAHQHLGAGAKLISSFVREIHRAAFNGLFFEEIVAVAFTPHGFELCRGFGLSPNGARVSTTSGNGHAEVFHAPWHQVMASQPFTSSPKVAAAYAGQFGKA